MVIRAQSHAGPSMEPRPVIVLEAHSMVIGAQSHAGPRMAPRPVIVLEAHSMAIGAQSHAGPSMAPRPVIVARGAFDGDRGSVPRWTEHGATTSHCCSRRIRW